MSSEAGDCISGPFKEGTIKYACYNLLKTSGPRGLSVRSLFTPHPRTVFFSFEANAWDFPR